MPFVPVSIYKPLIHLNIVLSLRCNLECHYCSQTAGPESNPEVLSLERYETWLNFFFDLKEPVFRVQLFGGEPLIIEPKVETYMALARSLARRKKVTLTKFVIVTNGLGLKDEERARRLLDNDVAFSISLDGPPEYHDRHRVYRNGRGSHADVMRGVDTLRRIGHNPYVLAVIADPDQMIKTVEYFVSEGLYRFKLSPAADAGRFINRKSDEDHWIRMADAHIELAKWITSQNKVLGPGFVYERYIANSIDRVRGIKPPPSWVMQITPDGMLHNLSLRRPDFRRCMDVNAESSYDEKLRSLGLQNWERGDDPIWSHLSRRMVEIYDRCATCTHPDFCAFQSGFALSMCTWRDRLDEGISELMKSTEFCDMWRIPDVAPASLEVGGPLERVAV